MSFERWMNYIQNAEKSSIISGKIRKVHYKFEDGAEMMEEYTMETGIIMRRSWKKKQNMFDVQTDTSGFNGSLFDWDIELGNTISSNHDSNFLVKESNTTVTLNKQYNTFLI